MIRPTSLAGMPCDNDRDCQDTEQCVRQLCRLADEKVGDCDTDKHCKETEYCNAKSKRCETADCTQRPCRKGWRCDTQSKQCTQDKPNTCSKNSDCSSRFCKDSQCQDCKNTQDCGGAACKDGVCEAFRQSCTKNEDCQTYWCFNNVCKDCQSATDCGGQACSNGRCAPPKKCGMNSDCSTNNCLNGVCAPRQNCTKPEDCPSLRCIDNKFCAGPCRNTGDCPNGRVCETGKCRKPKFEETCVPLTGCEAPLVCISDGQGSANLCRRLCNPLKPNVCPSDQACSLLPTSQKEETAGVCLPKKSGRKVGESCDDDKQRCEIDLVCRFDGKARLCRKLCEVGQNSGCASGEECLALNSARPKIGACLPPNCQTAGGCPDNGVCYQATCRKPCDPQKPTSGCSKEQFCYTDNGQSFCLEKECDYPGEVCQLEFVCSKHRCIPLNPAPKGCKKSSDCPSGEACVPKAQTSDDGLCFKRCKAGSTCSQSNFACVPRTLADKSTGFACLPRRGGGTTFASCAGSNRCERTHACLILSKGNVCIRYCDPTAAKGQDGCTSKENCRKLSTSSLGVCSNGSTRNVGQTCGVMLGVCDPKVSVCISEGDKKDAICRRLCSSSFSCPKKYRCTQIRDSSKKMCYPS